ncbi:MAG: HAD family hydrolase [Candidatus Pseudobacter hemicellulosilyticus]|uniref:D,D-heptose 1,7-bisphosphate phosphatase n=1 Tax=Candidatus Pseudobacter hemicellulosilyticus TaxID=3121375 RepID=A0AAJ5WNW6_9BACT|nr:MAG: HAD family hydrolase [Pseudobacter sp.]
MLALDKIGKDWTLFLDRDGVINIEKYQDYVYNYREFIFYEGVPEALAFLSGIFGPIVMTTNQRGIGRGLMTEADLAGIHQQMLRDVQAAGGRIDKIYYCPSNDNSDPNRKPNPGMAFQAKADFPQIDLQRSLIVGNSISDMEFGRNAGIHTVFVTTTKPAQAFPHPLIDAVFSGLPDFAKALQFC